MSLRRALDYSHYGKACFPDISLLLARGKTTFSFSTQRSLRDKEAFFGREERSYMRSYLMFSTLRALRRRATETWRKRVLFWKENQRLFFLLFAFRSTELLFTKTKTKRSRAWADRTRLRHDTRSFPNRFAKSINYPFQLIATNRSGQPK